jgi:hypothetical protein
MLLSFASQARKAPKKLWFANDALLLWFYQTYSHWGSVHDVVTFRFPIHSLDIALYNAAKRPEKLIRVIWRLGYPDVATRLTEAVRLLQVQERP